MWPFLVMCGTMGYLFHVWGDVGVGLFFFFAISICTELLCFGRGTEITCSLNNCFWNIWVALKRAWQVKDPP